jgi:hypothetical protein
MKKAIFPLLFTLWTFTAASQYLPFYENKTSSNALSMMDLKGKIKSIRQRSYTAIESGGTITKGAKGNLSDQGTVNTDFDMKFDDTAQCTEEIYYTNLSVKLMVIVHKYDKANNAEVIKVSESPGKISFIYTYKYNSTGKIAEEYTSQILYDQSTFDNKSYYKFNEKGNLAEVSTYQVTRDPGLVSHTIYHYDVKGYLTEKDVYNDKGLIWFREAFKVDGKGNVIQHDYYGPDCKSIEHSFVLKYDDHNNIIQKEYYQPAGILKKTYSYSYEYDKTNNWINRTDLEAGKATFVLERELDYY